MASRPWSPREVAVLERHADERDWIEKAKKALRERSEKAMRSRMQKVRADRGTSRGRCFDSAWMADAANASRRLLAATLKVGTWS